MRVVYEKSDREMDVAAEVFRLKLTMPELASLAAGEIVGQEAVVIEDEETLDIRKVQLQVVMENSEELKRMAQEEART